ncbi:unnamed protein product [Darwinula stevensoni]|uniref:C2H2-type domain-containing protein n=1 Tax=Darwinula stevensoni TaxID=69355 RepID=A0A7R9AIE0_9CRUS|nr:unnamed protein product [Darwinula stevensoni]CAG0905475.1 unnamed protein product [Darwinula stevensoni]
MPLPRKLVRGQDVWLGKGAEQTRQILKCMWCGQSFKSLADMTTHMQQTQHYTNIISQEQIISWKSPEEKSSNQSHVNAVLTCKVCNQGFSSLKELSNHMVKNAHYKEHIMRSISESGSKRRQAREKRKKSLPVRKLLELERAQSDFRGGGGHGHSPSPLITQPGNKITCEKCGLKVEAIDFMGHIRTCEGEQKRLLKSALLSSNSDEVRGGSNGTPKSDKDLEKEEAMGSPEKESSCETEATKEKHSRNPSVLNAIEKLIEKSFDANTKKSSSGTPLGANILRRLGIDENVDYSKPLIDSSGVLSESSSRERTPSESSSTSEKPKRCEDSGGAKDSSPLPEPEDMATSGDDAKDISISASSPASHRSDNDHARGNECSSDGRSSASPMPSGTATHSESAHPLAALQKLCDKTETHMSKPAASGGNAVANSGAAGLPGAILAFSWACNEAVVNNDSIMKCAFCDTPFISKGAYRHHLSKMHFVKDGSIPDALSIKAQQSTKGSKSPTGLDESPHAKFLKYSEMAKQLSSKYV